MNTTTALQRRIPRAHVLVACLAVLGCNSVAQIRIENLSPHDISRLRVANEVFGDVPAGDITAYRELKLAFGYSAMEMVIDGQRVTAQALNLGARRFTYRIVHKDLSKAQLDIEVLRERGSTSDRAAASGQTSRADRGATCRAVPENHGGEGEQGDKQRSRCHPIKRKT